MSKRVRLDVSIPEHGWIWVRLRATDVDLAFRASWVPDDSLAALAEAGNRLAAGDTEAVVSWHTEPDAYMFRFAVAGDCCRLEVRDASTPNGVIEGVTESFARAIWRSLRRLQGQAGVEAFEAAWGWPFPSESVARLGDSLRARPPVPGNTGACS